MTSPITPPSANIAFTQTGPGQVQTLTLTALRFLTTIVNAINGTTASGVSSVILGNGITISAGAGSPEGSVTGNIGDLYMNTNGGAATTLYVKERQPGLKSGWAPK